jgi:hypothetical protein
MAAGFERGRYPVPQFGPPSTIELIRQLTPLEPEASDELPVEVALDCPTLTYLPSAVSYVS